MQPCLLKEQLRMAALASHTRVLPEGPSLGSQLRVTPWDPTLGSQLKVPQ